MNPMKRRKKILAGVLLCTSVAVASFTSHQEPDVKGLQAEPSLTTHRLNRNQESLEQALHREHKQRLKAETTWRTALKERRSE